MTIDDYIKWANKEIDKNESYIQAADGLPGLYYDAEEVKGYVKNIEHYKQLVEYLEDRKKGYIHIDDVYRLIAGHSNYHGDSILSALTCIAEGKNVTKPITPLDLEVKNDNEIIYCRDCKYWKDSDGVYRRGINAESNCPINAKAVYEGRGFCYFAERKDEYIKEDKA